MQLLKAKPNFVVVFKNDFAISETEIIAMHNFKNTIRFFIEQVIYFLVSFVLYHFSSWCNLDMNKTSETNISNMYFNMTNGSHWSLQWRHNERHGV